LFAVTTLAWFSIILDIDKRPLLLEFSGLSDNANVGVFSIGTAYLDSQFSLLSVEEIRSLPSEEHVPSGFRGLNLQVASAHHHSIVSPFSVHDLFGLTIESPEL